MDKLAAIRAFVSVAEEGGFSAAAQELGLSKSAASRQIAALEEALGAQLLKRSTRSVKLTDKRLCLSGALPRFIGRSR